MKKTVVVIAALAAVFAAVLPVWGAPREKIAPPANVQGEWLGGSSGSSLDSITFTRDDILFSEGSNAASLESGNLVGFSQKIDKYSYEFTLYWGPQFGNLVQTYEFYWQDDDFYVLRITANGNTDGPWGYGRAGTREADRVTGETEKRVADYYKSLPTAAVVSGEQVYSNGRPYTGSGKVLWWDVLSGATVEVGRLERGRLTVNLPMGYYEEYSRSVDFDYGSNASPRDVYYNDIDGFFVDDDRGNRIGYLSLKGTAPDTYFSGGTGEGCRLTYYSKAVNIRGSATGNPGNNNKSYYNYSITAKAGWNRIYVRNSYRGADLVYDYSSDPKGFSPMQWVFDQQ
jgi:hypothetical protein